MKEGKKEKEEVFGEKESGNSTSFTGVDRKFLRL
jgi:hypothetical protein